MYNTRGEWEPDEERTRPGLEEISEKMDAFTARTRSTMHGAAMIGDLDLVRSFLESGVDVDVLDPHGDTPLVRAAQYGRTDVIRLLIERGADLATETGLVARALTGAVACGHADTVLALMDAGVDVNVHLGHDSVNETVPQPDGGVAITIRKENGETALHTAVVHRRDEIVQLLLDRGADVNAVDDDGRTPLHFCRNGRKWAEIIRLLKSAGKQCYHRPQDGWPKAP